MAIVDVKCNHCYLEDERIVNSRTDWTTMECRHCSNGLVEKIEKLYVPNVRLYGTGLYKESQK